MDISLSAWMIFMQLVEDPDGYKIEFIENKSTKSGLGN